MTSDKPRVRRISDTEIVVFAARAVAFEHAVEALERLGTVKHRDPGNTFFDGKMRYGLQSVALRVSLVEREIGQTTVVIQGSSDDVRGVGGKSATSRLIQMIENLDNPGFKVDRLGMNPVALAGALIGFVLILMLILMLILSYL